jgi:hypothetical protein
MKYFCFLFCYLFSHLIFAEIKKNDSSFKPYQAYIDSIDEDQQITVFNKMGMNWKTCTQVLDKVTKKMKCKEAVGWPTRDAKITVLGPPEKEFTIDPLTEEKTEETYVKIEYDYKRIGQDGVVHHQKGIGYIELYNLSRSAHNPYFGAQAPTRLNAQEVCPSDKKEAMSELKKIQEQMKPLAQSIQKLDVTESAKLLNQYVGICPVTPANKFPADLIRGSNSYDDLVLKQLRKQKPPQIANESGQPITNDDLVNIDSLARTLYGEMGKCFRYGLHYPIAVAKIIVNRANNPKFHRTFIQEPQEKNKPTLSKVATTLSQFSMWQQKAIMTDPATKKINWVPNGPLHQGLCPPRERGKPFYRSKEASQYENDIWTNATRIATEAIMYPKKFAARTDKVTDMHYTSDLAKLRNTPDLPRGAQFINKMNQVFPVIEGRQIDNNKCLEIWKGQ